MKQNKRERKGAGEGGRLERESRGEIGTDKDSQIDRCETLLKVFRKDVLGTTLVNTAQTGDRKRECLKSLRSSIETQRGARSKGLRAGRLEGPLLKCSMGKSASRKKDQSNGSKQRSMPVEWRKKSAHVKK